MNTARTIIGAHAFFFRAGAAFTVPANGVASVTAKPGATDAGWFDLGVSDWTPQPKGKESEFYVPAPGARVLKDIIQTQRGMTWKGKLMEMHNLAWQMILAAQNLPLTGVGGQYNPLGGDHLVRGWIKIQQYGQDNVLINTLDFWTAMKVAGDTSMGDQPVDVEVECPVLFSTLNTGTLA